MHLPTSRALVAATAVMSVTLSACGSAQSPAPAADATDVTDATDVVSATAESATTTVAAAGDAASDPGLRPALPVDNEDSPLPAVTVRDVVGDRWVQFADILPAEQPVLLWFWAPF